MAYRACYVFVEGFHDSLFFERIIKPLVETRYDHLLIVRYAHLDSVKRKNYLHSVLQSGAEHYQAFRLRYNLIDR